MVKQSVLRGRGQVTGALQWRVNAAGKLKVTPRAPPPWHRVTGINWVVGKTLVRIKLLQLTPAVPRGAIPPIGTTAWALAKFPSLLQVTKGCDRCSGYHRKRNAACAASLGIPTPMADPEVMYDFATGLPLSTTWELCAEHLMPRSKVASRIYRRIR